MKKISLIVLASITIVSFYLFIISCSTEVIEEPTQENIDTTQAVITVDSTLVEVTE